MDWYMKVPMWRRVARSIPSELCLGRQNGLRSSKQARGNAMRTKIHSLYHGVTRFVVGVNRGFQRLF
jgi:hypothetical protein